MKNPTVHPIHTWQFWRAYFVHMRPYLLFISGVAGMAGMAVAPSFQPDDWKTLPAFLVFFLSYGLGQALTDCFQMDTDKISAPYRPLSQGIVSPKTVGAVSLMGLLAGAALLVLFNPWNAVFGLLSILGLATYTKFKRDYWSIGPFYNAWIVALLPVMGYLTVEGGGLESLRNRELWTVIALGFFAYANFVLIGYLKDISADRATGYRTFPVVFGWERTVWAGDVLAATGLLVSAAFAFENGWSMAAWAIGSAIAVAGQGFAHFTQNKAEANASFPIAATVRSFILWHLSVILAFHPAMWPYALGFYFLFEMVLWQRPERGQI